MIIEPGTAIKLATVIDKITPFFIKGAKKFLSDASREVKLRLEDSYKAYLKESAHKYSQTKSFFFNRDTPAYLYEFYVPIAVESGAISVENPTFKNLTEKSKRLVILGTGGSGKSILMKHLFINCLSSKVQVPVFLELRELNSKKISLLNLISETLNSSTYSFDEEYIDKAIKGGHFAFILDGYDEVSNSLRKKLLLNIKSLSKKGKECSIIISSRPDDALTGMDEFSNYHLQSLSVNSACNLVNKLPYDEKTKEQFIAELRDEMYEQHKSFLSNPLLLSIMLLTYGQTAEIPTKLSIFYDHAYTALFQKHDASKGGYKRENLTNLDIQDFSKVFSVFCLQTYDKRLFGFSRTKALDFIDKSRSYLSMSFSSESYLEDALKGACLLIEDGLEIVFSHRSFQEYFVALHINKAAPETQNTLINKYRDNINSDNVISLLFEMNQYLVERELILPALSELFGKIGVTKKIGITHYSKYIKLLYSSINFREDVKISATLNKDVMLRLDRILYFAVNSQQAFSFSDKKTHKAYNQGLVGKYKSKGWKNSYETKKLTYRHPVMRDLASSHGYFSMAYLEAGHDVFKRLQKKHSEIESSLDELLK